jgi:hypothetical protein
MVMCSPPAQPELLALRHSPINVRHVAQLAGQAEFAEGRAGHLLSQRGSAEPSRNSC